MQLVINESYTIDSVFKVLEKHDFVKQAVYIAVTLKNEQKTAEEIALFFDNINSLTLIKSDGNILDFSEFNSFENIQEREAHENNFKIITLKTKN